MREVEGERTHCASLDLCVAPSIIALVQASFALVTVPVLVWFVAMKVA